jgi:SRSO17 transposase
LVGGEDAWLIIDDTALPKKRRHSVGVAPQYASALGKTANCQSLVSVTLASCEVPVMVGLRLFLPETWTDDPERMARARVPKDQQTTLTKPEIAIEEIDRVIASGARFGCATTLSTLTAVTKALGSSSRSSLTEAAYCTTSEYPSR